jgi:hypothetical protein
MLYADYKQLDAYVQKQSGSAVRVVITRDAAPATPLLSLTTGINWTDTFEQLPVEEAGEEGINEITTGRHSGSANVNGFWTAERNDKLPSRQNFLDEGTGGTYTIMEVVGKKRPGEETPVNVFTGCKISSYGSAHGARGLKTFDLSFIYEERLTGEQWAALTG